MGFGRAARIVGAALAASATSFLVGCAAHAPLSASLTSAGVRRAAIQGPFSAATLAERHELGASEARKARELRERLDAAFDEGRAAYLSGSVDEAFATFDGAVEAVLLADLDLSREPELLTHVDEVLAAMHALAVEQAAAADEPGVKEIAGDVESLASAGPLVPGGAAVPAGGDYSIPMVDHPAVDAMVSFYTGRAKERFETGLRRYGLYAPTLQRILAEEGMPPDLIWLSAVESNFNPAAHSRAKAKGLWQFIPGTGRKFGLRQDFWIDERADFEKATRSACRYLRELHGMFSDWHLALAAYNAGEGKIGRAIRTTGSHDFWQIRKTRHIRVETKNYVPAFLAVMKIMRDPGAHGLTFSPDPGLTWETASVQACTDLGVIARCAGTTREQVALLNPELRRGTTPGGSEPYRLRVPAGARAVFLERYAALPPEERLTWAHHVVRRGETLATIARQHGSSVSAIMAANKLKSANRIGVGWSLLVPTGSSADAVARAAPSGVASAASDGDAQAPAPRPGPHSYRVRPGDTLTSIAQRFGTTVSRLADWNGLSNTNRIRVGQRLVVSRGTSAAVATAASRQTHVVKRGDTLSAIARAYATTVHELREWNNLSHASTIHPGERLTILAR